MKRKIQPIDLFIQLMESSGYEAHALWRSLEMSTVEMTFRTDSIDKLYGIV